MLIQLSELTYAGFLINDTLVLTADVTMEREDRFQLDAGTPCDVTLKLPCGVEIPTHGQLLQLASPFFSDALEDMKASAPILVTGSLGTWIYILSCLYPLHNHPELTLGSVFTLLPVVHKYDFTKLLTRLVAFVKERSWELDHDTDLPARFVICWLALAQRLQLDELRELCLARLRGMSKEQRQSALTVEVAVGSGADMQVKHIIREEVKELGQVLRDELFVLVTHAPKLPWESLERLGG
ncbi:hypothetical protein FOA52_003311 [Chlamydomonas sp. UWO 241]|nr:hypothetical protein FOA52_003311 [Chlamydomonas sp. UWO 241]